MLKDAFQLDSGSQQELWGSSPSLANSEPSIPRLYSDAGSQTDVAAEVSRPGSCRGTPADVLTRRLCSVRERQKQTGGEGAREPEVRGGQEKVGGLLLVCVRRASGQLTSSLRP